MSITLFDALRLLAFALIMLAALKLFGVTVLSVKAATADTLLLAISAPLLQPSRGGADGTLQGRHVHCARDDQMAVNQFTGCSDKTLRARLKHQIEALDKFDNDPEAGGGGSPREFMLDRIEDLEREIEQRRQQKECGR